MNQIANVCVDLNEVKNDHQCIADIQHFATSEESVFLLDIESDTLSDIIDEVFLNLIATNKIPITKLSDEIRQELLNLPTPQLRNTFQAAEESNWIVIHGEFSFLRERMAVFVRLQNATNLGMGNAAEKFFFLIMTPKSLPYPLSAKETAISFASILLDLELRYVLETGDEEEIREALSNATLRQSEMQANKEAPVPTAEQLLVISALKWRLPGLGIWTDIDRRFSWYYHDYYDGFKDFRAIVKSCSAILFIYFACILPAIAFGLVSHIQTEGNMSVEKMIYAQAIAGVVVAVAGGQPLLIVLNTAPFAIYFKIIYGISVSSGIEFWTLYGWVGVWNSIFLLIFSITGFSNILKYSTRFSEECFGMFITCAFAHDGIRPTLTYFIENFYLCDDDKCEQAKAVIYLILVYGTAVIGYKLFMCKRSALLNPRLREVLSDYSLPIAVGIMSFVGSVIFRRAKLDPFPVPESSAFMIIYLFNIPIWGIALGCGLGFVLSLLFFMDQNLSAAATNHPSNHLKKGPAYHLDMYIMGTLMFCFSIFGLPWVNAAIPHSPFHARILADIEVIYHSNGLIEERIVRVRETRITGIIASLMIGISVLMVPTPLQEIPVPVLYGVFVYLSITALPGFQFWERLKLIFTQRNLYPPNSYLRKVPLKVLHRFTIFQSICILWLIFWGLTPYDYIQLFLGVALISIIPIRLIFGRLLFRKSHLRYMDEPTIGIK